MEVRFLLGSLVNGHHSLVARFATDTIIVPPCNKVVNLGLKKNKTIIDGGSTAPQNCCYQS